MSFKETNNQSKRESTDDVLPVPSSLTREAIPMPVAAGTNVDTGATASPADVTTSGSLEYRLKFAEEVHQYIREYIRLADQKATFFFTGGTALLAFLYKNNVSSRWLKPVMTWNILDVMAFVAMAALALAAFISLLVIIPRTPGSLRGYVFWEAVAEYDTGRAYADDLSLLSSASLFQIKAEHCFDLARVCRRKYRLLRLGLRIGAAGLAASLVVFLFV